MSMPGKETGDSLGTFVVTAYNIAHENDHPDQPKVQAKGLGREYGTRFLQDILMQGSGVDRDGRLIQIDWSKGSPGTPETTPFRYTQRIAGAAGRPVRDGVSIAVDPSVIPLGSWVCIDQVGWRRADDAGGKIVGKHIDLFMLAPRTDVMRWGRRNLAVWKEKEK
jgi:3D (Asp-Asp-Asp) domain-containing protein